MTRPRVVLAASALVLALCAGLLSACSGGSASADGSYAFTSATKVGTVIPVADRKPIGSYSAELLDGGTYSLAQYRGKAVVINFWATWCGPCATETPQFSDVYTRYESKPVTFVGVDFEDQRGNAEAFVKDNGIAYPIVYDPNGQSALELGNVPARGLPFTILLDRRHRVAGVYIQPLQQADLTPVLDDVVREQ